MSEKITSINYAGGTDKGKVRQQNEDSILLCGFEHSDVVLLIVADGVGGHEGGEVASKLAVESIKDSIGKAVLQAHSGGGYAENWLQLTLQHAVLEANKHILEQQVEHPQYHRMATTLVALLIHNEEIALSHLGDSRCYQFDSKQFIQLTEDHTVLQKMLNDGKIDQNEFEILPLHHMINQALGLSEFPDVYVNQFTFEKDTIYLLCSDGLTNTVADAQIQHVLTVNNQLDSCVDELITRANDNGGTDNISVVLVKIE